MAMQTWFVVRDGKEKGPFTGSQLKELAASGKLKPNDLVRRADVETARPASTIKGLFPEVSSTPITPTPTPKASSTPEVNPKVKSKKSLSLILVGSAVGVFFCLAVAAVGY